MSDALIDSLAAAVAARPDDLPLRQHLAELLVAAGRATEAIGHAAMLLSRHPGDLPARRLMAAALAAADPGPARTAGPVPTGSSPSAGPPPDADAAHPAVPGDDAAELGGHGAGQSAGGTGEAAEADAVRGSAGEPGGIDWAALEGEFADVVPPRFVSSGDGGGAEPVRGLADRTHDVEKSLISLADVGGMAEVKQRLEVSFLGPLRNPHLRSVYGKSLRGGLLLYGPPGCGKTFLARAVAGEMGAAFVSLSITDVLAMWLGSSERNLHELFTAARRHAPCVLFLDELDALGHKRSQLGTSSLRTLVNQLLTELDGVDGNNDGVYVLAATNAPWDVDPALRRPGRLDRTVLVLPPDEPARAAILAYHLRDRPVAGVDPGRLAAATEHYSGADLAHVCETAAEYAMAEAVTTGEVRMITQKDLLTAAREVRPSTDAWLATARNVALFGNQNGEYDDLAAYLKRRKLL